MNTRITIHAAEALEVSVTDREVTIRPIAKASPRAPHLALVRPVVETDGEAVTPLRRVG